MSPSVGENSWRDLRADMPLLTRGLRTLCALASLREVFFLSDSGVGNEPSLTVGLAPHFCRDFFVMRILATARAKALVVQRSACKCLRPFPSQADCFSPAR